ncbi:hypothetical protein R6Q59_034935 [Mikania micrantha]
MAKISSALYDYQSNIKLFYVPFLTSPTTGGVTASVAVSNQNTEQALTLPKKAVIQPHLLVRPPCYELTPVTSPTFGIPLLAVKVKTSGMDSSHSVTGSVYKARERIHRRMADQRLLTISTSFLRVAACNPN